MNPSGRRFRRTVWIVAGLHLGLIVAVGVPFATCQKPKKIQPVEIVDLGSLRPGPGSPAPPVQNEAPKTQTPPAAVPEPLTSEALPEPARETAKEVVSEPVVETPPPPKPEPKPTPKKELPKTETPPAIPNPPSPIPKKHEVKVSAVKTKAKTSAKAKPAPKAPPGPSAADIKSRLAASVPSEAPGSGGDGAGTEGRPDGIADDFSWYRALIKQTVQAKWKKPPIPSGEKVITEVSIRIAPDGAVTFLNLSKPSGDAAMDASVEAAVRAAARIPRPLPPGLGTPDYIVIIQFKLE
jgi:TonB family protein